MNINDLKDELSKNLNRNVEVKVYGMRGKVNTFHGKMQKLYPNIFTILEGGSEKSFSYADVITGEVKIKYE